MHDTLKKLVETHRIAREQVDSVYVYLDPSRASAQLELRRAQIVRLKQPATRELDLRRVSDILLARICHPDQDTDGLLARLARAGCDVTKQEVEQVVERCARNGIAPLLALEASSGVLPTSRRSSAPTTQPGNPTVCAGAVTSSRPTSSAATRPASTRRSRLGEPLDIRFSTSWCVTSAA